MNGEHFNGLPPDQAEALALLAEECGELVQAIGKVLRHGLWSVHPESQIPNQFTLAREIGDVQAALRICEVQRLFDWGDIISARDRKLMSVLKYLHHARIVD